MHINKKYLESKNLEAHDVFYLGLILQSSSEDMLEDLITYIADVNYRLYEEFGLIRHVKSKTKTEHLYKSLRLSKKGKEIYRNAQIKDFTKEDEALLEHLKTMYKEVEKPVGNAEKIKQMLSWFCTETEYTRRMVYYAVKAFIANLTDQGKEKFIPTLENLIWKAPNLYSSKYSLADSKLYQFIQEHKSELNANNPN